MIVDELKPKKSFELPLKTPIYKASFKTEVSERLKRTIISEFEHNSFTVQKMLEGDVYRLKRGALKLTAFYSSKTPDETLLNGEMTFSKNQVSVDMVEFDKEDLFTSVVVFIVTLFLISLVQMANSLTSSLSNGTSGLSSFFTLRKNKR